MRLGALATCALLLAASARPARADGLRYAARFEAGLEGDTNPSRLERVEGVTPPSISPSSLGRATASLDLALPIGTRQAISLSSSLAAKAFQRAAARLEDVFLVQVGAAHAIALGRRSSLSLTGGYYDVFQRGVGLSEARDFRSLAPGARLDLSIGAGGRLSLGAGWRWFTFKPSTDFSFSGPTASASYRHLFATDPLLGGADWEVSVTTFAERRAYGSPPCLSANACLPEESGRRRLDHFSMAQVEFTRTGEALLGAGLGAHGNLSNSYGEELGRLLAHVRAVVLLPWSVSLSGRGELVFSRYYDAVPLARDTTGTPLVSIEDEGRSTVRLELARPIAARFELGARYTLYSNEPTRARVEFTRQTVLLFLAALFDG